MEELDLKLEKLEKEYTMLQPQLSGFALELCGQVNKICESKGLLLGFPVQHRIKSWDSISKKIINGVIEVKKSVTEMQDIVGLRIIFLFQKEVNDFCGLVQEHFIVKKKYEPHKKFNENQFGYSSIHFVVKLKEEWLNVPTLKDFGGFQSEIQVRTISQHNWAEVSNKLQYKSEDNIPTLLRRSISRISALLEIVDLEFDRLLHDRDSYKTEINSRAASKPVEETLNVDLLEKILTDALPSDNKDEKENYASILNVLAQAGITTNSQLKNFLEKNIDSMIRMDKLMVAFLRSSNKKYYPKKQERLDKGVFYTHLGLINTVLNKSVAIT